MSSIDVSLFIHFSLFFSWFWSDFHMRTFCYSALQSICPSCPSWTHWELRRMMALHGILSKRQLFNTFISAKLFREELINSLLKPQRFTLVASVPLGLRASLHNHIYKCEILHDCYRIFLKLFAESSWKYNSCLSDFNLNRFVLYDLFRIVNVLEI